MRLPPYCQMGQPITDLPMVKRANIRPLQRSAIMEKSVKSPHKDYHLSNNMSYCTAGECVFQWCNRLYTVCVSHIALGRSSDKFR